MLDSQFLFLSVIQKSTGTPVVNFLFAVVSFLLADGSYCVTEVTLIENLGFFCVSDACTTLYSCPATCQAFAVEFIFTVNWWVSICIFLKVLLILLRWSKMLTKIVIAGYLNSNFLFIFSIKWFVSYSIKQLCAILYCFMTWIFCSLKRDGFWFRWSCFFLLCYKVYEDISRNGKAVYSITSFMQSYFLFEITIYL